MVMSSSRPEAPVPAAHPRALPRTSSPLRIWAVVGAVLVAAEATVLLKWVTGPNFQRVPTGPDQPPGWMRAVLDVSQLAAVGVALLVVYRLLIRPWIRDREVTLNGLFVIAGLLAAPWDGLSAFPQHWFNYNSYLFNRGSILSEVPGAISPNGPGYGQAWPFFGFAAYVVLVPGLGAVGARIMRAAHNRFPGLGPAGLVGVCVLVMMVANLIVESTILLPLGFYHLGGGPWPIINGNHYYGLPFMEVLHFALFFSVPAVIRYFVNDKGETIAERGANAIPGASWRKVGMRALAVIGAVHIGFLAVYHVPVMLYAINSREYPQDVKERSYLLGNTCGKAVDRACPGPSTPIVRPGSGYFDWEGNYVAPDTRSRTSRLAPGG